MENSTQTNRNMKTLTNSGKFKFTKENIKDYKDWQHNRSWYRGTFKEWLKEKEDHYEEVRREMLEQYLEDTKQYSLRGF